MRRAGGALLTAISAVALTMPVVAQQAVPDSDWRTIDRDLAATRYSPLQEINRTNVGQLEEKWSYPLRAFSTVVPLVIDGTMYFPAGQRVVALNADTGEEVWTYSESVPQDPAAGTAGWIWLSLGIGVVGLLATWGHRWHAARRPQADHANSRHDGCDGIRRSRRMLDEIERFERG